MEAVRPGDGNGVVSGGSRRNNQDEQKDDDGVQAWHIVRRLASL
jgi:hypothetical protein